MLHWSRLLASDPYEGAPVRPLDLQGWNSDHPVFADLVARVRPSLVVEVGTWKGASAIRMAAEARSAGLDCTVVCVDTWLGSIEHAGPGSPHEPDLARVGGYPTLYHQFAANVVRSGFRDAIIPLATTSRIGGRVLDRAGLRPELAYLDGSHEPDDVAEDARQYYSLLAPGGVLFGDDYGFDSVGVPVRRFARDAGLELEVADANFWSVRKPTGGRG